MGFTPAGEGETVEPGESAQAGVLPVLRRASVAAPPAIGLFSGQFQLLLAAPGPGQPKLPGP